MPCTSKIRLKLHKEDECREFIGRRENGSVVSTLLIQGKS